MYSDIVELVKEGMNDSQILDALADGANEVDRRELLAEIEVIRQSFENDALPQPYSSNPDERLFPRD